MGKEHWVTFPPTPAPAASHHPHRCRLGNFPLGPLHTGAPRKEPRGRSQGSHGVPGLTFLASRRKLINSFANPPLEMYRWLMFIEVFCLELVSLKSGLMFAKIHAVPVPSCARLLAPFPSQRFLCLYCCRSPMGKCRAGRLKM